MKTFATAFWALAIAMAVSGSAFGAIVYSGSQNVTLSLNPMSPMDAKTIQLGGMSGDWDDFRVELWLERAMPGTMMMTVPGMVVMADMATKLAIYAPRSAGMTMGMSMDMSMAMGGILGLQDFAFNLPMGGMVGPNGSFLDWAYLHGSGEFGESGGYVGLRTAMGHFGWLHVLRQSDIGTNMHSLAIDGWAYEDLPGIAISAGETGGCDWKPGYSHKMHWPQLPDLGFTGIDIALTQMTLADDFKCTSTGPIRDIHIWGSFSKDELPKDGPGGLTFELTIYSDVPATDKTWSKPGNRLWSRTFRPGEYTVRRVHDGPEDWYNPARGEYVAGNHRFAYQYNFCIDRDAFTQEEGKIYWLAVKESSSANNYSFGWKTTAQEFRWNDDAVYLKSGSTDWVEMAYPKGHKYGGETLDLAFVITDGDQPLAQRDLGDAPDSSNSVAGAKMLAYPSGVLANFPTVYQAGSPPYGPVHMYPRDMYYLGKWVSLETDADVGLDDDGFTNIDPASDIPDRDGGDDGLKLPVSMPFCQSTTLDYDVTMTGTSAQRPYVNVWCDWNRDGDWDDQVVCPDGAQVPEWAVQNHVISVTTPGTYTFTTPSFRSWYPTKDRIDPMWLRISIADRPWTATDTRSSTGGCGPAAGYRYGETEDYYLQFKDLPLPVKYDWGDAPTGTIAPGYPTIAFNDGARHVIAGPWLGDEKDKPDAEADGQPDTDALGDDNNGSDDENGVSLMPLVQGIPAGAAVKVGGGGGVVQAWIDFNNDKSWQNTEKVFDGFLPDGVHTVNFVTPNAAVVGKTFARFRISRQGGLGPQGAALDGEVEDYLVTVEALPDVVKRWCQRPNLTPEGIDIRVDNGENLPRMIADDFGCKQAGLLTHIRLWGSWKDDKKGQIKKLRFRIHPDDPVGPAGADTKNKYSKPGPETLWEQEFFTGQFTEKLYETVEIAGEWWWDPGTGDVTPGGDKQVWQLDFDISPDKAFLQQGSVDNPMIYWLEVAAETADGQFGWKTRWWPDHFMDDAVFYAGPLALPAWHEMFYPLGHKYFANERNSIDMAFCLQFAADTTMPTSQPGSLTQCPAVRTTCPMTVTECLSMKTACPVVETSCPAVDTQCPAVNTQCPPSKTKCPPTPTECQVAQTVCPATDTRCPVTDTKCPVVQTQCPPVQTQCPPTPTECVVIQTECPVVYTRCPTSDTKCPPVETQCPIEATKCPPTPTECQVVRTQCPVVSTECPVVATQCPPVQTQCPPTASACQPVDTECPVYQTRCPPVYTQCPATSSTCQPVDTQCPPVSTRCPPVQTQCPAGATQCDPVDTVCPVYQTRCPPVDTQCPATVSVCQTVDTQCPPVNTQCPVVATDCPEVETQCGGKLTQCPIPGTPCGQIEQFGGGISGLVFGPGCPVVETSCPTVSTYLALAQLRR